MLGVRPTTHVGTGPRQGPTDHGSIDPTIDKTVTLSRPVKISPHRKPSDRSRVEFDRYLSAYQCHRCSATGDWSPLTSIQRRQNSLILAVECRACSNPVFLKRVVRKDGEDIDPDDLLENKPERTIVDADNLGAAIYADLSWDVNDRLNLTLGARYTYDEKEYSVCVLDSGGIEEVVDEVVAQRTAGPSVRRVCARHPEIGAPKIRHRG